MSDLIPSELLPVIYIGVAGGIGSLFFKYYWQHRTVIAKQQVKQKVEDDKPENKIDQLLDHIPDIIADRKRLLSQAVDQAGADSPMAKSLSQQIGWLETLQQYQPVVDFAKPLLKTAINTVQKVMSTFGRG